MKRDKTQSIDTQNIAFLTRFYQQNVVECGKIFEKICL
jgi:hypothetical protein